MPPWPTALWLTDDDDDDDGDGNDDLACPPEMLLDDIAAASGVCIDDDDDDLMTDEDASGGQARGGPVFGEAPTVLKVARALVWSLESCVVIEMRSVSTWERALSLSGCVFITVCGVRASAVAPVWDALTADTFLGRAVSVFS